MRLLLLLVLEVLLQLALVVQLPLFLVVPQLVLLNVRRDKVRHHPRWRRELHGARDRGGMVRVAERETGRTMVRRRRRRGRCDLRRRQTSRCHCRRRRRRRRRQLLLLLGQSLSTARSLHLRNPSGGPGRVSAVGRTVGGGRLHPGHRMHRRLVHVRTTLNG